MDHWLGWAVVLAESLEDVHLGTTFDEEACICMRRHYDSSCIY